MGWLRLVGSFKLQGSFAEYRLFYGALLQTRLIILRCVLIVATPYMDYLDLTKTCLQICRCSHVSLREQFADLEHSSLRNDILWELVLI